MRLIATLAIALSAALAAPVAAQDGKPNPDADQTINFADGDAQMNAAIAEAQASLPTWLAVLANPPRGVSDLTFKFPLEGYEHIWVADVRREGNMLTGQLANNPQAPGWTLGDRVRVPLSDVTDWGYWDADGVGVGFYTIRVMLDYMSPAEVRAVRQAYGWTE